MPDLDKPQGKEKRKDQGRERYRRIRSDEDQAAVSPVDPGADKGREQHLRKQAHHRSDGKGCGGIRLLREIPDDRKLHELAAKQRKCLPHPERYKTDGPITVHGFHKGQTQLSEVSYIIDSCGCISSSGGPI